MSGYAHFMDLLGPSRLKELMFTARLLSADEALAAGFVHEIVPPEQIESRVREQAERIASHAPITLWVTKEAIRRIQAARPLPDGEDLIAMIDGSADFAKACARSWRSGRRGGPGSRWGIAVRTRQVDEAWLGIADAGRLFRSGDLSPVQLTQRLLERIARLDDAARFLAVTGEVSRCRRRATPRPSSRRAPTRSAARHPLRAQGHHRRRGAADDRPFPHPGGPRRGPRRDRSPRCAPPARS